MATTLQTHIKKYDKNFITNYSLFLGGLNATQKALEQYDPLKTGYARIFFIISFLPTSFSSFTSLLGSNLAFFIFIFKYINVCFGFDYFISY